MIAADKDLVRDIDDILQVTSVEDEKNRQRCAHRRYRVWVTGVNCLSGCGPILRPCASLRIAVMRACTGDQPCVATPEGFIVVVNVNGIDQTLACLKSLERPKSRYRP